MWILFIIFMKNGSKNYCHVGTCIILFRGNSSSKLNLIFVNFSSKSSEFLVNDLIKSLILIHSSLYYLIFSSLSSVETSAKYLFPLISSKYPLTLLKIRYKGFSLVIFKYFRLPHIQCIHISMSFHLF